MPKLLYLVTEDWFFRSHFLPMARAASQAGFEVVVATRCQNDREAIQREGLRVVELPWRRSGEGPLGLLADLLAIARLIREESPEILHCIALKPVVLGGLAARVAGRPHTVCAVTGLGRTSIDSSFRGRLIRAAIRGALRFIARDSRSRLLVENRDHERVFIAGRVAPQDRVVRVPGAGVDVARYRPADRTRQGGEMVVALVARMIPIKGVQVTVEAARILFDRGTPVRLLLVGSPDPGHDGSITEESLRGWSEHPAVQWIGRQENVVEIWAEADVAALPSLGGDGLPRALIEAAACGKPIVTTDTDGCREVVRHGVNGLLVPPGDATALADALSLLAADPALRLRMGRESRRLAVAEFREEIVTGIVSDLYLALLSDRAGQAPAESSMP